MKQSLYVSGGNFSSPYKSQQLSTRSHSWFWIQPRIFEETNSPFAMFKTPENERLEGPKKKMGRKEKVTLYFKSGLFLVST